MTNVWTGGGISRRDPIARDSVTGPPDLVEVGRAGVGMFHSVSAINGVGPRLLTAALIVMISSCAPAIPKTEDPPRVELLLREGCANSSELEEHLRAALGRRAGHLTLVDQDSLETHDLRRGYATPTVLVNGRDLFGLAEPKRPFPSPT